MIDAPGSAEGIETVDAQSIDQPSDALETAAAPDPIETPAPIEVVVVEEPVTPDIAQLALRASVWSAARAQAVADGLVEVRPPAPSNTDLSLLPAINLVAAEPEAPEAEASDEPAETDEADEPADVDEAEGTTRTEEADGTEGGEASLEETETEPDPDGAEEPLNEETEAAPAPPEEEAAASTPPTPDQVNGRVPPPAGGPTAGQWDELRACESTHNYQAINHTGTYRGAYQFSQQTWDWVAGIHLPHLVGVDPAQADPAWQDIMAYTLYAMRGWDQWPICGQNLL